MVNIKHDILEADDQMFVIADVKDNTANMASVIPGKQLKCEDIFYMSAIKKCKCTQKLNCVNGQFYIEKL